jgi:hypothetical protein
MLLAVLTGLLTLAATSQLFAQEDVIEKRQKLMKSNSAAAKRSKAPLNPKITPP